MNLGAMPPPPPPLPRGAARSARSATRPFGGTLAMAPEQNPLNRQLDSTPREAPAKSGPYPDGSAQRRRRPRRTVPPRSARRRPSGLRPAIGGYQQQAGAAQSGLFPFVQTPPGMRQLASATAASSASATTAAAASTAARDQAQHRQPQHQQRDPNLQYGHAQSARRPAARRKACLRNRKRRPSPSQRPDPSSCGSRSATTTPLDRSGRTRLCSSPLRFSRPSAWPRLPRSSGSAPRRPLPTRARPTSRRTRRARPRRQRRAEDSRLVALSRQERRPTSRRDGASRSTAAASVGRQHRGGHRGQRGICPRDQARARPQRAAARGRRVYLTGHLQTVLRHGEARQGLARSKPHREEPGVRRDTTRSRCRARAAPITSRPSRSLRAKCASST